VDRKHVECEITSAKALTLSEIIKLALAHDIGANHLEEYNNCEPIQGISKDVGDDHYSLQRNADVLVIYLKNEKNYLVWEPAVRSKYFYRHCSLRAPPSLS
jgi:hypothetical protein